MCPSVSMESASGPPRVISDATLRVEVRPVIGGSSARLRFSNLLGTSDLALGEVTVAQPASGTVTGTTRVTFAGAPEVTVAPGQVVACDPVKLPVTTAPMAVSFRVSGSPGPATGHPSYGPAHGSTTVGDDAPFAGALFLVGLDVLTVGEGVIVAFGDSITEGAGADRAYTEVLNDRLRSAGSSVAVLNAGVGGDAVRGVLGRRLAPDVLDVPGVVGVILAIGTNDLGGGSTMLDPPTAEGLVAGMGAVLARLRARSLRVWVSPVTPFGDAARPAMFVPHYSTPGRVALRESVNALVRALPDYDPAVDFDHALRDPVNGHHIPEALSGDNLHPNGAGQTRMAESIELDTVLRDLVSRS